jgi:hypothetical protein
MLKLKGLLLASFVGAFPAATAQNTCHGTDVNSAHFIQGLNGMMDTSASAFRGTLQMPLVTSSEITLVTDATVCARAGLAADSVVKVWEPTVTFDPTTDPLYVINIGTSHAVVDLNSPPTGDHDWVFIFGPLWEYRGSIWM